MRGRTSKLFFGMVVFLAFAVLVSVPSCAMAEQVKPMPLKEYKRLVRDLILMGDTQNDGMAYEFKTTTIVVTRAVSLTRSRQIIATMSRGINDPTGIMIAVEVETLGKEGSPYDFYTVIVYRDYETDGVPNKIVKAYHMFNKESNSVVKSTFTNAEKPTKEDIIAWHYWLRKFQTMLRKGGSNDKLDKSTSRKILPRY